MPRAPVPLGPGLSASFVGNSRAASLCKRYVRRAAYRKTKSGPTAPFAEQSRTVGWCSHSHYSDAVISEPGRCWRMFHEPLPLESISSLARW
jgi:hypothetical protein